MTDDSLDENLLGRLRVIESQPLSERAEAYRSLHDELSRALEKSPGA
ncbi:MULTISPECIES: hypothetical protein [Microbacterium]|nr:MULTISPECIES: hypothetical protein [Microbacterium]NHI16499.1 hypothetical protein [Microbacterium excoecariae]